MREFNVYFSFYSEEWGNFDDTRYLVTAENPFEAREKAWDLCDRDSDTPLRSNIKQFAVTWEPNLLDTGDYFYSHAAGIKQCLGRLMNVEIPNDRIAGGEKNHQLEAERCSDLSSLWTLDAVAKDLYKDKGMIPPSIHEELYYAEKLCEQLGWDEKAYALWKRIEKAKKWDNGAIYSIRDLFRDGYTELCGEAELFNEHFGRNGVYPIHNKIDERDYSYISRWQNKRMVDSLMKLPFYNETDVIRNSASMDYAFRTLLLKNSGYQIPENQLWQLIDSSESGRDPPDGMLFAENLITGRCVFYHKSDFVGVLRPDIVATLDFDALKKEYAVTHSEYAANDRNNVQYFDSNIEDEDDIEI